MRYQQIIEMCKDYKEELLKTANDIDNISFNDTFSKREICMMANNGNENLGILVNKTDPDMVVAVAHINKKYDYYIGDTPYKKRNEFRIDPITGDKTLKYYIQANKGSYNGEHLKMRSNQLLSNCTGGRKKLYVFASFGNDKSGYKYLGRYINQPHFTEYDNDGNSFYYFILKNINNINDRIIDIRQNQETALIKMNDDLLKENKKLNSEEKQALIKVRMNQSFYRENLMDIYKNGCPLTGISNPELLIASHIKPYSVCKTNKEKCSENNGIILSALADKLFDRFLITFDEKGKIKYSNKLSPNDLNKIKNHFINDSIEIRNEEMANFLKYHRERFYEKCTYC